MHSIRLNPMELSFLLVGKVESRYLTEFILICASHRNFFFSHLPQQVPNSEPQSPPPQNGANLPHKWCCCTVSVRQCVWKASSVVLNK